MWQGVMKAWSTIQSGLEQQDPKSWAEITRQPIFGNRYLTNPLGTQWGTEARTNLMRWAEKDYRSLKDLAQNDGRGWRSFAELQHLRRSPVAAAIHTQILQSIPWQPEPRPIPKIGQWLTPLTIDGDITQVFYLTNTNPETATLYTTTPSEQLHLSAVEQPLPAGCGEVRIVRSGGPKNATIDFNSQETLEEGQAVWLWGNKPLENLEWDPKDWTWQRIGMLPETNILNYSTKRGYRLRAQLLWAIWCQRVAHAFSDEIFHLGVALWNAWRNTIYCAIEAYKELFRHKRNEEKRQELISCFQQIWTASNIFGRLRGEDIKWNITPPDNFLPQELGAWLVPPIRVHRLSPSPDPEAAFTARPDFPDLVNDLVNNIGSNWRPPVPDEDGRPATPPQEPSNQNSVDEPGTFGHNLQPDLNHNAHPLETPHQRPAEQTASTSQAKPKSRPKHRCRRNKPQRPPPCEGILTASNVQRARSRAELPDIHFSGPLPHASDQENQPPRAGRLNPSPAGVTAKSRPKTCCKFGPNRAAKTPNVHGSSSQVQGRPESPSASPDDEELDSLLLEIGIVHQQGGPSSPQLQDVGHENPAPPFPSELASPRMSHPRSRPKVKCTFGPLKRPGGIQPPPLQPYLTQTATLNHDSSLSIASTSFGLPSRSLVEEGRLPETSDKQTGDRVTLAPPIRASFLDRFRASDVRAPRSTPHRSRLRELGISQEEFDVQVAREVDEALAELAEERRQVREPSPPTTELPLPLVPLTKDECLRRFFPGNVRPSTGPMVGVYSWAADLGWTRFNFDFNFDTDDINLLNAYD